MTRILGLHEAPLGLEVRDKGARERLPIGIVLDAAGAAQWQQEIIDWFQSIKSFDTQLYAVANELKPGRVPRSKAFGLLYDYSRSMCDPFRQLPLTTEMSGEGSAKRQLLQVATGCESSWPAPTDRAVLIWLAEYRPSGSCLDVARYGIISVQLGHHCHCPPYWDEVSRGDLMSDASLWWHDENLQEGRRLQTAQVRTDLGLAFTRNAKQPLVAVAHLAASICMDILCRQEDWLAQIRQAPVVTGDIHRQRRFPSTMETAGFVIRKVARSVKLRMEHKGRAMGWFLGLRRSDARSYAVRGNFVPDGLETPALPAGGQMADPFLLDHGDRTFLYFEDLPPGRSIARLACSEVRGDGSLAEPVVVLERDHHLSYPCVFSHRDDVFMIPESLAAQTIELYRASRFPYEFRLESTCLEGFAAADTTPIMLDGKWYFFTTTPEPFMQTLLFWSDRLDGKWHYHPKSPISCSAQNSRSAGAIKFTQGRLLRPTQDCSVRYGYAILVNEIERLTPTEYRERPVDRILPNWRSGLLGTHTWNYSNNFEVFDGLRHLT